MRPDQLDAIEALAETFSTPWEPEQLRAAIGIIKKDLPIDEKSESLIIGFNDLARDMGAEQVRDIIVKELTRRAVSDQT